MVKEGLTNIDIYVLARELSPKRFSKIVRTEFGYKIKLQGERDLLLIPGRFIIPTAYVLEAGRPDNLSIISRKRMGNSFVRSVSQVNFDRILRIDTEAGSIIIESFGDGNIILTDPAGRIIYALHERDWRDRSIRRGVMYNPPPPPKIHPDVSLEDFSNLFTAKDAVRSLVRAGLPPIYAEELCILAGIDKNTPVAELSSGAVESLYSEFTRLISRLEKPEPVVVLDGETIVDVTPIPLKRYGEYRFKRFDSFSEALDYLTPYLVSVPAHEEKGKREGGSIVEFWQKELTSAQKQLSELEAMIEKAYEHSFDLSKAIELARSGEPVPKSIGPFRLKRIEGKELVFEFTPQN